jgi:hypothetical protein
MPEKANAFSGEEDNKPGREARAWRYREGETRPADGLASGGQGHLRQEP